MSLPNNKVVQDDLWKVYNNLVETDKQIAAVLEQLKDDGLYDSTMIVFYADHGGPLPRQKRLIYDSGLKVPMIIKFPNNQHAGSKDDQLISFIDFAPTTIKFAGGSIPSHMHGKDFIGSVKNLKAKQDKRKYIHAAADRFDGFTDTIRAVRDDRFKYIRNYRPEQGYYLPVSYRERIPTMNNLLSQRDAGKLNDVQMQWFRTQKPIEELFDTQNDPHELNNLAQDPSYQSKLVRFRAELARWLAEVGDQPGLPEAQLIKKLWNGQDQQPITATPKLILNDRKVEIKSETQGAVISYQILSDTNAKSNLWILYRQPLSISADTQIKVIAHRIGYVPSEEVIKVIKLNG